MKRIAIPIYFYRFFDDLIFIYPLYAVMFSERGLSALQISVLLAVWSTIAFLLEIPSGAIADKYSRKHILFFAQIVRMLGYSCWIFFPCFWGFLLGFICWGIKSAFTSGTLEALVFDELKYIGETESYAKVMGCARSYSTAGNMIATLLAAWMIKFGYNLVIAAGLVSLVISSAAIMFLIMAPRVETISKEPYLFVLKIGLTEALRNRIVLRLIMFLCFALVFLPTLDEYWSLFYKAAGIPLIGIPLLSVVVSGVMALAGMTAYRWKRLSDKSIIVLFTICGIALFIASRFMQFASILSVPLICFLWVVIDVLLESRLQQAIEGVARATVLSVRGFVEEVSAVIIYMGWGATATKWGYSMGFAVCAAVIIITGILWLVAGGKNPFGSRTESRLPEKQLVGK